MYVMFDNYLANVSNQFSIINETNLSSLKSVVKDVPLCDIFQTDINIVKNILYIIGSKNVSTKNYLMPFYIENYNLVNGKDNLIAYIESTKMPETLFNIKEMLSDCIQHLDSIMQRVSLLYESSEYFGYLYTTNSVIKQKRFNDVVTELSFTIHGYTPIGVIQDISDLISGIPVTDFDNGSVVGFKVLQKISNRLSEQNGIYQYYVNLIDSSLLYSFNKMIYSKLDLQNEIVVLNYNNVRVRYALNIIKEKYLQKCSSLRMSIYNVLTYLS